MKLGSSVPLSPSLGFAAASLESSGSFGGNSMWVPGTEYTYEYDGRLLTGIPELSSTHFSGIGIKCTLNVVVTRTGRIVLRIREGKFTRVNQVSKIILGRTIDYHLHTLFSRFRTSSQ